MDILDFAGQTLDGKYHIERELGRGGMGTVYLANHLGTERPVAVKIISPQFMERAEFVERFRREARAAGRLRHPNVVDVTDFGFASTEHGQVAYLVMEYLDGCTLGEILDEEKNLPIGWTLDILDQVSSAVHEAHQQGIIHRDLKPDNIWLEPNQRGGYTVKVLDFGIAKLEEHDEEQSELRDGDSYQAAATYVSGRATHSGLDAGGTRADGAYDTRVSEASTVARTSVNATRVPESATLQLDPLDSEKKTAIFVPAEVDGDEQDSVKTRVADPADAEIPETIANSTGGSTGGRSLYDPRSSSELTRVGAVLGTPLYMSPEQCRGEKLDARSDIYSLSVIAYQMLSGSTPFTGNFTQVMDAHKELPPPPLKTRKVRKKLRRVIMSALEKDPAQRPQTAEGFASELRSRSVGIWDLVRRAVMIYTEHLPKFLAITILIYLPFILTSLVTASLGIVYVVQGIAQDAPMRGVAFALTTALSTFLAVLCGYLAVGTITWIVNQVLAVPLRPVRIRPAVRATMRNWKRIVGTGLMQTVTVVVGLALCVLPGLAATVLLALVAPVVMMEGAKGFAAFKRSKTLVMRSLATTTAAVALLFFVPLVIGGATGLVVALVVDKGIQVYERVNEPQNGTTASTEAPSKSEANDSDVNFEVGTRSTSVDVGKTNNPALRPIAQMARETLQSLVMLPVQIVLTSLSAIIFALLYLKTRQAGGENLGDLFRQFEESDQPRKKWQERVQQRLQQSGRISSNPSR